MGTERKKIIIFLILLILTGPFAFLWLSFIWHKEEPKVETENIEIKEEKEEIFEWKSIWDE
ncbi:hypothetical protein [Thermococcus sp.]